MAIPKIIHFLWMSETKDEKTEACLASWRKHLDGYEIKEWNGKNFPYRDFVWTKEAVEAKSWAYVTDFFRLWVLYNYGGIYLDADVMLQQNFDTFLHHKVFIGTEFTCQLGAHCIGSEVRNEYIKACLDFYHERHFLLDDGNLNMVPIPRIMTYILIKKYNFTDSLANFTDNPILLKNEIVIFPDNYFTIDISDGKNVGVHLGLGSWRIGDWKKFQPIYSDVIENYFVNKFFLHELSQKKGIKKILYALLPNFIISAYRKKKHKIKNIKRITNIEELYKRKIIEK